MAKVLLLKVAGYEWVILKTWLSAWRSRGKYRLFYREIKIEISLVSLELRDARFLDNRSKQFIALS
jgi:hypothetical protein